MSDTTPSFHPHSDKPVSPKTLRWIYIAAVVVLLLVGALGGYQAGLGDRRAARATVVARQLSEQFQLALQAMENKQYELAQTHLQYVLQNDPNFPGAKEKYAELLILMAITPTPTPTLTPTVSPTPDLRAAEEIFQNAQELIAAQKWSEAIATLDTLRKKAPSYRTAEVDGMYYIALRMRGMDKLMLNNGENCQDVNLEGGIYDLTLAERFGPLDRDAAGWRNFARLYIAGASFWNLDWKQAQAYFAEVYPYMPNLMDTSCMTAQERFRYATLRYAEQLLAAGDYCGAEEQFNLAFSIPSNENATAYPTATEVYVGCHGHPAPQATATPTPTGAAPTTEPVEPTATEGG